MEEYIGYGLVIFVLTTIILVFKKLFKQNNDSLGYEDEILKRKTNFRKCCRPGLPEKGP
mgnify:CR=1 FL=1